ncbi:IS5/IS1182 family transposase, partial [Lacticaseibacillus rhamnosus]
MQPLFARNAYALGFTLALIADLSEELIMVYRQKATQLSLESFGSALGTPLSPDNEWVQYAELIPWAKLEEAYQLQFP